MHQKMRLLLNLSQILRSICVSTNALQIASSDFYWSACQLEVVTYNMDFFHSNESHSIIHRNPYLTSIYGISALTVPYSM